MNTVPDFVIAGHPNEGKSSVLSTLAEDDSVRISPVPGETTECRIFPVIIDGREIMRFIDTPGFQNPGMMLRWMQSYRGNDTDMIRDFTDTHSSNPAFRHDCELIGPMKDASGIIFVADGSRPLRNMDRAEMEILRLTGRPRMAILNCKQNESAYLEEWQHEFRKHFNSIRIFNSLKATYTQRIELFESLKAIDQQLAHVLDTVIQALRQDWAARTERTAEIITGMISDIITYSLKTGIKTGMDADEIRKKLLDEYQDFAQAREREAHRQIRRLFRHNIFNCRIPAHSILQQDLFSEKTWNFLGLTHKQLVIAGAMGGAAIGAGLDLGHGGLSMGMFAMLGGIAGASGAAFRGRELLTGRRFLGIRLDEHSVQVGPADNIQLMYILIDRALLFYSFLINWAHGRRDYDNAPQWQEEQGGREGIVSSWDRSRKKACENFFQAIRKDQKEKEHCTAEFTKLIRKSLVECSLLR